jgi:hypothetical protein
MYRNIKSFTIPLGRRAVRARATMKPSAKTLADKVKAKLDLLNQPSLIEGPFALSGETRKGYENLMESSIIAAARYKAARAEWANAKAHFALAEDELAEANLRLKKIIKDAKKSSKKKKTKEVYE